MNDTFVREVEQALRKPMSIEVDGHDRLIVPSGWSEFERRIPVVSTLKLHTLTGFVDYCTENRDTLERSMLVAHVAHPGRVELLGPLENEETNFRRAVYAMATTELLGTPFPFGNYVDSESFFIGLQTQFVSAVMRDELLLLVASIKESSVRENVDDTVSQEVTTRRGLSMSSTTRVPNPVLLRPYRTFREVDQPDSLFVLRMRSAGQGQDKPTIALFEADGGAWKIRAVENIAMFLEGKLGSIPVIA